MPNYKLVNNNCECAANTNCLDCPDGKSCVRCKIGSLLNVASSPHSCVGSCPSNTYEYIG